MAERNEPYYRQVVIDGTIIAVSFTQPTQDMAYLNLSLNNIEGIRTDQWSSLYQTAVDAVSVQIGAMQAELPNGDWIDHQSAQNCGPYPGGRLTYANLHFGVWARSKDKTITQTLLACAETVAARMFELYPGTGS